MGEILRCQFIIPRKKRACKMLVKPGRKFCGEHSIADPENELSTKNESPPKRIPCPLDPKHSVDVQNLEKHLAKCNARLEADSESVWVVENFNSYPNFDGLGGQTEFAAEKELELKKIDRPDLEVFIEKICSAFEKIERLFIDDVKFEPYFESFVNSPEIGAEQKKHLLQQASIAGHLRDAGLLKEKTCFVEFGAGRAKLAYWLARIIDFSTVWADCSFLLIEKSGLRYKFENKFVRERQSTIENDAGPNKEKDDGDIKAHFLRLRCGIEHVNLKLTPFLLRDPVRRLVAVCKHLCGSATDFALISLLNSTAEPEPANFGGAALAPCCHHRCIWESYVGRSVLLEFGFSREQFKLLTQISSWATCGFSKVTSERGDGPGQSGNDRFDRESVGVKCKAILDYCRGKFFENRGFVVEYKYFAPRHVTPENILLVIKPKTC